METFLSVAWVGGGGGSGQGINNPGSGGHQIPRANWTRASKNKSRVFGAPERGDKCFLREISTKYGKLYVKYRKIW
jgi:hypothetical protein